MKVRVLGAARQVGRSALLVQEGRTSLLLDYGALQQADPAFPLLVRPKDIDAVLLTHAHLDHSGGVPLLFSGSAAPKVLGTEMTRELSQLIINDFIKISGPKLPFDRLELKAMMRAYQDVPLDEPQRIGELEVRFHYAGHIPGSAMVEIKGPSGGLLYTGDVNDKDTRLLKGLNPGSIEADLVVTESTYGQAQHPDREEEERKLVEFANEIVEGGGTLLIPSFAIARAQEIALIFYHRRFKHSIAMDGMALEVNKIFLEHPEFLHGAGDLEKALKRVELVTSWEQRRRVVEEPGVIISPAGMLGGGAAVFYNEKVAMDERNGIAIVSFQANGTPGRTLLDKGLVLYRGRPRKIAARLSRYYLSSHSDADGLMKVLSRVSGARLVLTVHGEESSAVGFAKRVQEALGLEAAAPSIGESFEA
jgi:putative mRNA 3-end processing factor